MSELYVHRWGKGPRAIFGFHGWSGDHRTFEPLVPHMGSSVSLFAFDQPGSGRSGLPARWDLDAFTEPMIRSIDAMGFDRVELVASCSGAFPALRAALELGPKVSRVVLIDAFAFVPWYFRLLTVEPWGRLFYRSTFANPVGRSISNFALSNRRRRETHLTDGFRRLDHDSTHAYLRMICSQKDVRPYAPVESEVDLVFGRRSFNAVRASIPIWRENWPEARVHELDEAAHLPIEEATCAVSAVVFGPEDVRVATDESRALTAQNRGESHAI